MHRLIPAVYAFWLLAGCSAPVGVAPSSTTCQKDSDCPSGRVCALAFTPHLCIPAADGGTPRQQQDSGMSTELDAGQPPVSVDICAPCEQDSDCGGGGNFCLQDDNGVAGCGSACESSQDCPANTDCFDIQDSSGNSLGGNCFPSSRVCGSTGPTVDVCSPCQQDSDCGGGNNLCLQDQNGVNGCGTYCQSSQDCPSGDTCYRITDSSGATLGTNCFPTTQVCGSTPPPTDGGTPRTDGGTPPTDGGSVCTTDTWGNFAQAFFQNNCTGCHNHSFGNSSVSYSTIVSESSSISSRIQRNNMPPGGGLTSSDKPRILKWLSCGGPR